MDPRATLKKADSLLVARDVKNALIHYMSVAQFYAAQGFALKSIAIWKQIRSIAQRENELALDADARKALVALYRSLSLNADADALENESRKA